MHVCSTCNLKIEPPSPVATYESKFYHPDCLTCHKCTKSLSGRQFIKEKNGSLTCEECNEKYSSKCNRCKKSFAPGQSYKKITDDLFFHNECFKCAGPCRSQIGSEFYDLENGKFLCVGCYDKYGMDFEKYVNDEDDELLARPPPPLPMNEPPRAQNREVEKLSNRIDKGLKLDNSPNVELLPSVQREREREPEKQSRPAPAPAPAPTPAPNKDDDLLCAKCGEKLVGTYTVYNEKKYHTKCFVCVQCNQEFKEKSFFKLNGNPLCRTCHSKNLVSNAPKCRKCYQPILDTVVTFKSGEYHDYCLVCTICHNKLVGQSIYTDKQDNPFCTSCFTKKEGKTCAKCLKSISPNQTNLIFEEKHFHKECFTCMKCSRQINSNESFYKSDDGSDGNICAECVNK